jgi:uncharacterized membrane protein
VWFRFKISRLRIVQVFPFAVLGVLLLLASLALHNNAFFFMAGLFALLGVVLLPTTVQRRKYHWIR